jgi:predicted DNA-binding helix-hairpin-helix protein
MEKFIKKQQIRLTKHFQAIDLLSTYGYTDEELFELHHQFINHELKLLTRLFSN